MSLPTTNPVCSHLAYFELTQHLSLSAPQDLSAPLHLFTSRVSFHLSTHHSSVYLWPNTRFHQLPAALTASHPPFHHHHLFFFGLSWLSHLIPLSQPPASISLPLPKTPLIPPSHPLGRPVISLSLQPAQSTMGVLPANLAPLKPLCVCLRVLKCVSVWLYSDARVWLTFLKIVCDAYVKIV